MPRKQRIRSKSGYYHIMLRGNERRNIFNCDEDKQRFLETVYEKKQGGRFNLHAFCLMDNHIHLMISEGVEDVATVMKRITVSYVYYFNKKYRRVGHLFQDRFKSEVVERDVDSSEDNLLFFFTQHILYHLRLTSRSSYAHY